MAANNNSDRILMPASARENVSSVTHRVWRKNANLTPIWQLASEFVDVFDSKLRNLEAKDVFKAVLTIWMESLDVWIDSTPAAAEFTDGGCAAQGLLWPVVHDALNNAVKDLRLPLVPGSRPLEEPSKSSLKRPSSQDQPFRKMLKTSEGMMSNIV
ncbi:hypothetical protein Tdes44962_MAKER03038 [Teratosphaeria destructans]|uniref:Uncharacterized protein n=1 Tax=Teratosphaeria destructans TaxID=418781 RepID=A0A9W7W1W7_9PEZI|nr:hypothetical protein Tdes44962_MAKER03038 [Teratosphaeria destructans]